jgi:MT0933-like antitoxin protein
MGMFDNLKGKADQLKEKASGLVDQHGDKIDKGLNKAGEIVDQKTGGKYTEQIATGKAKAREQLDNLDGRKDDFPQETPPAPIDPAAPIPPAEPIDPAAPRNPL